MRTLDLLLFIRTRVSNAAGWVLPIPPSTREGHSPNQGQHCSMVSTIIPLKEAITAEWPFTLRVHDLLATFTLIFFSSEVYCREAMCTHTAQEMHRLVALG